MGYATTGQWTVAFCLPRGRAWTEAAILFVVLAGLAARIGIAGGLWKALLV